MWAFLRKFSVARRLLSLTARYFSTWQAVEKASGERKIKAKIGEQAQCTRQYMSIVS